MHVGGFGNGVGVGVGAGNAIAVPYVASSRSSTSPEVQ
jgi:hypothetical protein